MSVAGWPGGLPPMGYDRVSLSVLCFFSFVLNFTRFLNLFFLSGVWVDSRYMAPLQGVVSVDGNTVPSAVLQVYISLFTSVWYKLELS